VGLSNDRLLAFEDGQVTFATKNGQKVTVSAQTFIGRFLLHVLPKGYVKIRHYGLLSASHATTTLEQVRVLIKDSSSTTDSSAAADVDPLEHLSWKELYRLLTGQDLTLCPRCGRGQLVPMPLDLGRDPEEPDQRDTS
jgi:hypothetical protein